MAASDQDGTITFYEVVNVEAISTVNADIADLYRRNGYRVIERRVPARTLGSLIEQSRIPPPDLLCIDVEGHEEQVLRGIPLADWQPQVAVIESTLPNTNISSHARWEPLLLEHGYIFAAFNGINRFYLRGDLHEKRSCFAFPVNCLDAYRTAESVEMQKTVAALTGQIAAVEAARLAERALYGEFRADIQNQASEAQALRRAEYALLEELRGVYHDRMAQAEAARARWEQEQARQHELEDLVRVSQERLRQCEHDLEDLPKLRSRLRQLAGREDELDGFRAVVQRTLPPEAVLAVVSEGDDRFLYLGGRTTWHFPRAAEGAYAGYPATSAEAIAALEAVREQGARYLIVPAAHRGWFDLYPEFRQFVESRFEPVPDAGPPGAFRNVAARAARKGRRLWRKLSGQPGGQAGAGRACQMFDLWDLKGAPEGPANAPCAAPNR